MMQMMIIDLFDNARAARLSFKFCQIYKYTLFAPGRARAILMQIPFHIILINIIIMRMPFHILAGRGARTDLKLMSRARLIN